MSVKTVRRCDWCGREIKQGHPYINIGNMSMCVFSGDDVPDLDLSVQSEDIFTISGDKDICSLECVSEYLKNIKRLGEDKARFWFQIAKEDVLK